MAELSLYLIGAPGSGKSSVFDALTNTPDGQQSFTKGQHHLGSVKVPDTRLERLREMYKPKKFTPAEVTFADVALPPTPDGKSALSQLTDFLGDADAFVIVVQAFGEMDYRGNAVDPTAQLESVLLELVVADLERVEKRLQNIAKEVNHKKKTSDIEASTLKKCQDHLETEKPLRTMEFTVDEEKAIKSLGFLSLKPIMVVANVSEDKLDGSGLEGLREICGVHGFEPVVFCATLEAELALLDSEAQSDFLKDYGLNEPARARFIQAAYRLLDLISFFTVGEDEVRAWTIHKGTTAHKAAGKIHSDIERGFIRAETVACEALFETESWAACRENATLRLEGKTYEVKDGEVVHFRHNT